MPNGNTSMQYPFPYKNASGSSDIYGNGNFIVVTAGNLNVTGNATITGTTTTSILVVTGAATANTWDGSGSLNGDLFSSQSNTSPGTSATAMYRMFNSSDDKFDIAIASRLNSTYNGKALIKSSRSIYINTNSGESITLNTNGIARVTITDSGMTLSQGLAVGSGGTGITSIGTNGQVLTSNGASLYYSTPTTGVTSVAATVPSFLSISGSPITTNGTLSIGLSGTALPVANGGTGLTTVGSNGTILQSNGSSLSYVALSNGTVTSVSASVPSFLAVSGSPITTSGTLAITLSGTALPVASGGTGVTASSGASSVVIRDASQNISVNQLTSTVSTGTAPLVVASSTLVGNLNVNYLNGVGFASPTVNSAVELNGSAQFITNTFTGTGSHVRATNPTLVTPTLGSATTTSIAYTGSTSGTVTSKSITGTYNWNLPATAGNAGDYLTSQAGGSTAMTWTTPFTYAQNGYSGGAGSTITSGSTTAFSLGTQIISAHRFNTTNIGLTYSGDTWTCTTGGLYNFTIIGGNFYCGGGSTIQYANLNLIVIHSGNTLTLGGSSSIVSNSVNGNLIATCTVWLEVNDTCYYRISNNPITYPSSWGAVAATMTCGSDFVFLAARIK